MTISKIEISRESSAARGKPMNHRERRIIAKRLVGRAQCDRHGHSLSLHGTTLYCKKCADDIRKAKHRAKRQW